MTTASGRPLEHRPVHPGRHHHVPGLLAPRGAADVHAPAVRRRLPCRPVPAVRALADRGRGRVAVDVQQPVRSDHQHRGVLRDQQSRLAARPGHRDAVDRDGGHLADDRVRDDALHRCAAGRADAVARGCDDRRREPVAALPARDHPDDLADRVLPDRDVADRRVPALRPGRGDDRCEHRRVRPCDRRRPIRFDPHDRALHVQPDVQLQRVDLRARVRGCHRVDARDADLPRHRHPVPRRWPLRLLRERPHGPEAPHRAGCRVRRARLETALYHAMMIVITFNSSSTCCPVILLLGTSTAIDPHCSFR